MAKPQKETLTITTDLREYSYRVNLRLLENKEDIETLYLQLLQRLSASLVDFLTTCSIDKKELTEEEKDDILDYVDDLDSEEYEELFDKIINLFVKSGPFKNDMALPLQIIEKTVATTDSNDMQDIIVADFMGEALKKHKALMKK